MTREQRRDRDLVWVAHASSGTADRAERRDANDPREDRLRELREYLARPIQAWLLDDRAPLRSKALRAHIFREEAGGE
jgi:hypothetical protein